MAATESPAERLNAGPMASNTPDSLADALLEHFDVAPWRDHVVPQPDGSTLRQRMAECPPVLSEFAEYLGVRTAQIHEWATALDDEGRALHPGFAEAYRRAQQVQARRLKEGVDLGLYVESAVPFLLSVCAWRPQPALDAAEFR